MTTGKATRGPERVGVLVMSHGTPRSLDELADFYTEIRRGRPPTPELLADLERRYRAIGGLSPLTERTEAQVTGITSALDALRPGHFVVASGTKYSSARIEDAVRALDEQHVRRVIGIVLAPHSSAVSVGEYARRARRAVAALGADRHEADHLELDMVDHWHLAPGLVSLLAQRVRAAGYGHPHGLDAVEVIFTAHSVPMQSIDSGDTYREQVHETATAVAQSAQVPHWRVAWQSAGKSGGSWLGPDLLEVISELSRSAIKSVLVCPIGFVSDHLEILYDLDIEAARHARSAGVGFCRTDSLNDDPEFCETVAQVVLTAVSGS